MDTNLTNFQKSKFSDILFSQTIDKTDLNANSFNIKFILFKILINSFFLIWIIFSNLEIF